MVSSLRLPASLRPGGRQHSAVFSWKSVTNKAVQITARPCRLFAVLAQMLGNPERNARTHVSLEGYLKLWRFADTLIVTKCFRTSPALCCQPPAAALRARLQPSGRSIGVPPVESGGLWSRLLTLRRGAAARAALLVQSKGELGSPGQAAQGIGLQPVQRNLG